MKTYFLLLVFIAGSLAQEDLSQKGFLFPEETSTAHVILKPETSKPLKKFTVCLRSYTELTREHTLFSLATAGKDNMVLIFPQPPNHYSICINNKEFHIKVDTEILDWKHTCMSWDSDSGLVQLWVNRKLYVRKVSNKGFIIPSPASIILGQDQDSYGGGFQASQCFVGEINQFDMWDYALSLEEINQVLVNEKNGNVLNWTSLSYEIKGGVLVVPLYQCKL
uniref:Pentraxin family member n=1 Tax=Leptobrachium leishanense TaxID=445787 RepID=A0A8C5QK91_9ANUR